MGYSIAITSVSKTMGVFNFTHYFLRSRFKTLVFRWMAALGEHLQFFPVSLVIETDQTTQNAVFDVPFDYPNLVQWS